MVEHILRTLSTVLKHKVKEVIDCLEKRCSRTRLQKLEELVIEYIRLREKFSIDAEKSSKENRMEQF